MEPELIGYSDKPSVAPGESIDFKVSTDLADYEVAIVRLIHGDANGPGFKEEVVATLAPGRGRKQATYPGSFAVVEADPRLSPGSFTLTVAIMPTTPEKGSEQGIVARWSGQGGFALLLDAAGRLTFRAGAGDRVESVTLETPLRARQWYRVAASFEADTGDASLRLVPLSRWPVDKPESATAQFNISPMPGGSLTMAALAAPARSDGRLAPEGLYNGRIEEPVLFDRVLTDAEIAGYIADGDLATEGGSLAAGWDFSLGIDGKTIHDIGPAGLNGHVVNVPMRAVTGSNWSGNSYDFKTTPTEYAAIHFHDDDLEDAGWATDFTWQVPASARSGFYGARLSSGGHEDHIPFFVRPARGKRPDAPRALVLAPTFTYLAYACERLRSLHLHAAAYTKRPMTRDRLDYYLEAHPEFGNSLYDVHSDGSGYAYSTWRRPITSMRPKYRQWQVAAPRHCAADLNVIDWLEAEGLPYDVITDHDLDAEGLDVIDGYKVVITGTHPEYWSGKMLDAVEAYLDRGGRHMYLGGNGYYWVTAADPARPYLIEVRRGNAGSRAWNSEPGELYYSSTGEMGGLWRHRGRAPNRIAGIGFAAMGYDAPTPGYRRQPASFDPRAAFIFEGVGADEVIGNFGLVLGGAAGDEIDRVNFALGSPPHILRLAIATGHDQSVYMPVLEDYAENSAIVVNEQAKTVEADIAYFETNNGGAVFAAGAISWCGSLSHNNYDNNVARITGNVLRRFLE